MGIEKRQFWNFAKHLRVIFLAHLKWNPREKVVSFLKILREKKNKEKVFLTSRWKRQMSVELQKYRKGYRKLYKHRKDLLKMDSYKRKKCQFWKVTFLTSLHRTVDFLQAFGRKQIVHHIAKLFKSIDNSWVFICYFYLSSSLSGFTRFTIIYFLHKVISMKHPLPMDSRSNTK